MRTKWIVLTALVAGALLVGAGFAMARQHRSTGVGWDAGDMVAMHQAMQGMHAQMPAELREQCDAMHAQMGQMMEQMGGGMMGGTSSGGGMMSGGGMAAHHGSAGGESR
jgi:Spy/CpxP family protein refolding chaperone